MASVQHPAVQELNSVLKSLPALKPPGVTKSKVEAANKLCLDPQNTALEPAFIDVIADAFKQSPHTHKLGVLYIVDSITRQWALAGATHAVGVRKMTDVLPVLMYEFLPVIPETQKEKLSKLLDIWSSTKTFPAQMLADFKHRMNSNPQTNNPPLNGNAPHQLLPVAPSQQQPQPSVAGASSSSSASALLAALSVAPQQAPAPPPVQAPPPAQAQMPLLAALAALQQQSAPPAPTQIPHMMQPPNPVAGQVPPSNIPVMPQPENSIPHAAVVQPNWLDQIQLLQRLSQQVTPEQFASVVAAMGIVPSGGIQAAPPAQPPVQHDVGLSSYPPPVAQPSQAGPGASQYSNGNGYYDHRDRDDRRARSRSPDFKRRRVSPPNRRDSPTYGAYDPSAARNEGRGEDGDRRGRSRRGFGRNEYRQRTPPPPPREHQGGAAHAPRHNQPKLVGHDPKLGQGKIKVLSRTLFVGGVKTTESELRNFFRQFGGVQSCIVNHEKRHAFLKLISHQDAIATKQSVEALPDSEYRSLFERVGWAVGFGPTHCADYNVGVSVIPIDTLTDADRKWMLSAEYGGTGGKPIQAGMVVEEPDIEIGAGPSSKAISRRGGGSGRGGRFFGRGGGDSSGGYEHSGPRFRKPERSEAPVVPEPNTVGPPPPVPNFGSPIPGLPMNFR